MLKQRHQLFVTLLGCADAGVACAACMGAWLWRLTLTGEGLPPIIGPGAARLWLLQSLCVFTAPLALLAMRMCGLYQPWRDRRIIAEGRAVVNASLLTIVGVIVVVWAVGPGLNGALDTGASATVGGMVIDGLRLQLALLAILLPVALVLQRATYRMVLRSLRRRGKNLRHVAVIGTGRLGRIVCRTLDRNSWTGIHVAYFVDHHESAPGAAGASEREILGRPVRGGIDALETILERHRPDSVYLAIPNARAALMPQLLRRLERFAVDVRIIPDVSPRYTPFSMTMSELEGMPILSVRENPMLGPAGAVKRVIDVVGAVLGVLVFAVPMALIALAIKVTSPGPVIFRQRRVSLGGEEFDILKFRTMRYVEDERAPATWTGRDDPRVTRLGRALRCTSLDELPQLFNVLVGDMSLVGPRPERPELIAKFREDWRGYVLRQHVKAGMTGWAQVNGLRGDTSLRKRLQHDLFYIRNWSLAFDLKILWLTLFRGFVHRNAH